MTRAFPLLLSTLAPVAVLFCSPDVYGDEAMDPSLAPPKDAQAYQRNRTGNALYRRAKWSEAAAEYEAGAKIEDTPVFDYNLGQCYRLAGRYQDALAHYERFLNRATPGPDVQSAVQSFIAELRSQLSRTREMPPTEPAPTPHTSPPPVEAPQPAPELVTPSTRSHTLRYLGWGLSIAGIAGTGVTTYLGVDAHNLRSQSGDATRTMSDRYRLSQRADSRQSAALIVGVASGAALAAGILTLVLTSTSDSAHQTQAAWHVSATSDAIFASRTF